jgi:formylglycine-generating enzyme required for sulfatase activity
MMNGTAKTTSHADLSVFRALAGCNVGFQHWHPVPVTPNGDKLAGQGDLGGVWEWTSTPLRAHEGFKAMDIYPGYTCKCAAWHDILSIMLTRTSADFFDGKHNIIQGGSWATMPRIAGRTTL